MVHKNSKEHPTLRSAHKHVFPALKAILWPKCVEFAVIMVGYLA